MRLLHGALVILVLWQISQFRSLGNWVWTLCLPKSSRLLNVGSKDSSWEELACESLRSGTLSSTRFSLNSCSHSGMSEHNGPHRSIISSACELDRVSLSLDDVVGEVDELQEDVGWLLSCLEGVLEVEWWELEEELDDKPGTTIGTKFSVSHCIRIPFFMGCGFWLLIHS